MAKEKTQSGDTTAAAPNDGRFGAQFDDELDVRAILKITAGLAIISLVSMVLMWALLRIFEITGDHTDTHVDTHAAQPAAVRMPAGPQLQAHPEAELVAMRQEQAAVLHGFGWVDEVAGTVHVPIDTAMDLLLAELAASPSESAAGTAPEPVDEETVDTSTAGAPEAAIEEEETVDASGVAAGDGEEGKTP